MTYNNTQKQPKNQNSQENMRAMVQSHNLKGCIVTLLKMNSIIDVFLGIFWNFQRTVAFRSFVKRVCFYSLTIFAKKRSIIDV